MEVLRFMHCFFLLELDLVLETEFFVKRISSHANFVLGGFVLNSKANLLWSQEEIDHSGFLVLSWLLLG